MRIFPEKKHRHESLIKPVAGLIVMSILLSLMISNDNHGKTVSQEQEKLVITETNTPSSEAFSLGNATVIETLALKATSKKQTVQEMIDAEGGVVAYFKSSIYLLIDTNNKTITRITSYSVEKTTYTGDLVRGITTSDYSYKLSNRDSIKELDEKYLGPGKHKKVNTYLKGKVTSAEAAIERVEHWYDYYNERFKGYLTVLGSYEQNNNSNDGHEPIKWIVLHSEGNKTLLASSLILARGEYNDHVDGQSIACSWKSSRIRNWLNNEFYNEAFSDDEKAHILNTQIEQDGETTKDKVFLLNIEQAENYFRIFQKLRQAAETESSGGGKRVDWWLISSGDKFEKYYVNYNGAIDYAFADKVKGIRPAIWVDSSSVVTQ